MDDSKINVNTRENALTRVMNYPRIQTLRVWKTTNEQVSIDRSAVNQALSKAIAYKNCGKDGDAETWHGDSSNSWSYPTS